MSLRLGFGPMFSNKTKHLFAWIETYMQKGLECLLVNYQDDTRYGRGVASTHKNALGEQVQLPATCTADLNAIRDQLLSVDVIGIDEIQFFPNCVKLIRELVHAGKRVFVVGLDSDYKQQSFPGSCLPELIPLAHSVEKYLAVCDFCPVGEGPHKAPMSWRIVADAETKVIGGSDKYGAICHHCLKAPVKTPRIRVQRTVTPI